MLVRFRILTFVLPVLFNVSVLADGKYFRMLEVADEPGIHNQRALIVFKDGQETLIVESDVTAKGDELGWLLPLPAQPTEIKACAPYTLKSLVEAVKPILADKPKGLLLFTSLFLVTVIVSCVFSFHRRDRPQLQPRPLVVAGTVTILLFVIWAGFTSSLGMGRGITASKADVLAHVRAGVYDISVIRGDSSDAVVEWLTGNGFACPPSAKTVIGDYIARNWVFAAAKVAADIEGKITPHPVRLSFPAQEAVYPMKLTGVGAESIALDLFVISEKSASVHGMTTWVSGILKVAPCNDSLRAFTADKPLTFEDPYTRVKVGTPDATELMWKGCVLTRLHGRLEPDDMQQDLLMRWKDPKPYQRRLFSIPAAASISGSLTMFLLGLALAWATENANRKRRSWGGLLKRGVLPCVLVTAMIGVGLYGSLDVVRTDTVSMGNALAPMFAEHNHAAALNRLTEEAPRQSFNKAYKSVVGNNDAWGRQRTEPHQLEEPGDYCIESTDDGWILTISNQYYMPRRISIEADGIPVLATSRPTD